MVAAILIILLSLITARFRMYGRCSSYVLAALQIQISLHNFHVNNANLKSVSEMLCEWAGKLSCEGLRRNYLCYKRH
uniref:Putative secreted protein n=1 Tax=Amblyomma triste TaxID=251400 RepID=A0A023FZR6_AMBTT